jgi:Fe-S-cluster containining protein
MYNNCIFNSKKLCDDCGQCDVCDLNNKKICNNCGKCLEMNGVDIRAIKIDEISEGGDTAETAALKIEDIASEVKEYDDSYLVDNTDEHSENNETWELIDDVDGLSEVLEDDSKFKHTVHELYPGLVYIDKNVN